MTFDLLNRIAVLIMSSLALTLFFAPGVVHWLFALEGSAALDVFTRRAAMLFAGLITLVYLAQGSNSLEAQHMVSATMLVVMFGLLVLGTVEFLRGSVGPGISLALIVEAFFAFYYFRFWRE